MSYARACITWRDVSSPIPTPEPQQLDLAELGGDGIGLLGASRADRGQRTAGVPRDPLAASPDRDQRARRDRRHIALTREHTDVQTLTERLEVGDGRGDLAEHVADVRIVAGRTGA